MQWKPGELSPERVVPACAFLWRGGVKHWLRLTCGGGKFVWNPRHRTWIGPVPRPGARIILVDDDVWSGTTLLCARDALRHQGYDVAGFAANVRGRVALPGLIRLPAPVPRAPLVSVSGRPGTGKSALAHQFAEASGGAHVRWAGFVASPGRCGEQAARAEAEDPLVFARRAAALLASADPQGWIILDGPKSWTAVQFLAYALNRPLIPVFVEGDEETRRMVVRWRGDADDQFDAERDALFRERFEELRQHSFVLDPNAPDHGGVVDALAAHGLRLPLTVGNTVIGKEFLVKLVLREVQAVAHGEAPDIPEDLVFHHRYSQRYGVPGREAQTVDLTASAFRIIDDIIDEHETRRIADEDGSVRYMRSVWREIGLWNAVIWAVAMLRTARARAADKRAFDGMLRRVADATLVELKAERDARAMTPQEYAASLDKEIAFREWVASLAGYDRGKAREDAIIAQRKNDRYASGVEAERLPQEVFAWTK